MRRSLWLICFAVSRGYWCDRQKHQVHADVAFPTSQQSQVCRSNDNLITLRASRDNHSSRATPNSHKTLFQKIRARALAVDNSYHLVWSPGVLKQVALVSGTLLSARFLIQLSGATMEPLLHLLSSMHPSFRSVESDMVLPLLASSCCMLQLLINIVVGGCAGFNTILGPIRPFFLSLLVYLTATTRYAPNWAVISTMRWSLALFPEGLQFWNTYKEESQKSNVLGKIDIEVELDIPTMGCVACINTIDRSLLSTTSVVDAFSALKPLGTKGGQATVRLRVDSEDEIEKQIAALVSAVERAGFDQTSVISLRKNTLE